MNLLLLLLAVLGFAAAFRRLAWSGFLALRAGVDRYVARQLAETRARTGDLTGMEEARSAASSARRAWLVALARVLVWVVCLALPPFTRWTAELYAALAVLWLPALAEDRRAG